MSEQQKSEQQMSEQQMSEQQKQKRAFLAGVAWCKWSLKLFDHTDYAVARANLLYPEPTPARVVLRRDYCNAAGDWFRAGDILERTDTGQYTIPGERIGGPATGYADIKDISVTIQQ